MKKALSLLLAIAMVLSLMPMAVFAAATPTIYFETDFTTDLGVGDTFTVTGKLKDNTGFSGVTLSMDWNENAVAFTGFQKNGRVMASDVFNVSQGYQAPVVNEDLGIIVANDLLGYDLNGTLFIANFEIVAESGGLDIGLKTGDATEFELLDMDGNVMEAVIDTSALDGLTVGGASAGAEIPDGAPFTAITTDAGNAIAIEQQENVSFNYADVPYYIVTIPADATTVYVTDPNQVVMEDYTSGEMKATAYAADIVSGWSQLYVNYDYEEVTDGIRVTIPMNMTAEDWSVGTVEMCFVDDGNGSLTHAYGSEDSSYACTFLMSFVYDDGGEEEPETYSITIDPDLVGGTLTASDENGEAITEAAEGDVVYVTITPASGYTGTSYTINGELANDLLFLMPAEDVVLSATFTEVHTCTYDREAAQEQYLKSEATCESGAVYYMSCECGEFDNSESAATFVDGDAVDHNYVDGKCEWCGEDEEVPHECDYDQEVAAEQYLKSGATCEVQAVYYMSCICGLFDNSEDAATFSAGALASHNYVDGVCDVCGAAGYTFATSADVTAEKEGNAIVSVLVTDHSEEETDSYNAYDVTLTFDPTKLEYVSCAGAVVSDGGSVTVNGGTIRIVGCGEAKSFATAVAALTFKTLTQGDAQVTVTEMKVSDKDEAIKDNAPTATAGGGDDETPAASAVKVPFDVEKPDYVAGNETVLNGDDYTFSFTDTENYTYEDLVVKVGGEEVDVTDNADGTYTIPAVDGNVEITVTQTPNTYDVTFDENNTAVVEGEPTATYGTDYTFTVTPSEYKMVESVTVTLTGTETTVSYSLDAETGVYTIAGGNIAGDMTITVVEIDDDNYTTVTFEGIESEEIEGGQLSVPAKIGEDFTFTLIKDEENWTYTVMVGDTELTADEETGAYTIPGDLVTEEGVTVTVTKEEVKDLAVDVTEYITLDGTSMFLVTAMWGNADTVLTYGENTMFFSDRYTVTGYEDVEGAYCWLVVSTAEMNTIDQVKAAAEAAIAEAAEGVTATAIAYDYDVNRTTVVDVNDAQLVYDMYNASYMAFSDDLPVRKFLEADMETDMELTTQDVAAIINYIVSGAAAE